MDDIKTQWNVRMLLLQNGICCGIFKNASSSSSSSSAVAAATTATTITPTSSISSSTTSSILLKQIPTTLLLSLSTDGQFLLVCGSGAELVLENGERIGIKGSTHLTRFCPKRFHSYVKMLLDFRNKFTNHNHYSCRRFYSNSNSNSKISINTDDYHHHNKENIFHTIVDSDNDDSDDDYDGYDNELMTMDNSESAGISLSMLSSLEHELPLLKGDDFNAYPLIPTIVEYVDGDLFMLRKQDNNNNDNYNDIQYKLEGWQCKSNDNNDNDNNYNYKPNYNNIQNVITLDGNILKYKSLKTDSKERLIHLSCFTTDIDANGTVESYELLKSEENIEPSLITIISKLRWHVLRLITYRAHFEQRIGLSISSMKNIIPEKCSLTSNCNDAANEEKVVSIISASGAKLSAIRNATGLHPLFISVQGLFHCFGHDSLNRRQIERTHVTINLLDGKIDAVLSDGRKVTTILEYCVAKANSNMIYSDDPVLKIIPHVQELLAFLRWANLSPSQQLEQKEKDEEIVRRARAAALQNNRYLLTNNIKSKSLSPMEAAKCSSLFETRLNIEGTHGYHNLIDEKNAIANSIPTIDQLIDGATADKPKTIKDKTIMKKEQKLSTVDIVERARHQMKLCQMFLEGNKKSSDEYEYKIH